MHVPATRAVVLAAVCAALLLSLAPEEAAGQPKSKSVQTEAIWVDYDDDGPSVTVKVVKPGRGEDAKRLKKNKQATFRVKPEGSVLTKTTVTINGRKAELDDIPTGKTVNVYWRPDENDPTILFARKIDVIFSDEELEERYPDADAQ